MKSRDVLLCLATALVVAPLSCLLGYSVAAKEKFEWGRTVERLASLQDLRLRVQTDLGYRVRWHPVDGDKARLVPDQDIRQVLYEFKDSTIYVIETNGVRTLATDE